MPVEEIFGWSGTWDDLPAWRGAAVFFDLMAAGLLLLIGRRLRGPALGVALAYAWAAYPFPLYTLESGSNDALPAVLVLAAVLAATYRSRIATGARGALSALAGLSKLAPLALAAVMATHGLAGDAARAQARGAGAVPGRAGRRLRAGAAPASRTTH